MQGQVSNKWTSRCSVWIEKSLPQGHSVAPLGKPCDALSMDIKDVHTLPMK